jgi:hypothetical protein
MKLNSIISYKNKSNNVSNRTVQGFKDLAQIRENY